MREAIREPLVKSTTRQINKTAHGFSLLAPVYFNGTTWVLAYANNVSQSNVTGIVTRIIDANRFEITTEGYFKLTTTSGSLVANTVLYLTATGTAGAVPTTTGHVKKALIIGESSSSGFVNIGEGEIIGIHDVDIINENTPQAGVTVNSTTQGTTLGLSGETWTAKDSNRYWRYVAMSADGVIQTATANGDQLYVSTDSGNTWIARAGTQSWSKVAMSTTGQIQTAVTTSGYIWVSINSGNTWTQKNSIRQWYGVDVSSDGTKQTATVHNGQIYVSTDSGNTWTPKDSNRVWRGVAMSANGTIQTATVDGGQIYISNDSGNTWTPKDSNRAWRNVAMSADGTIQTAVVYNGQIYVSTDSGNTWTPKDSNRAWRGVAMTDNGVVQTATVDGGRIYISTDSGNTWTPKDSNRAWRGVAISADGTIQTAVTDGSDKIYVSTAEVITATVSGEVSFIAGMKCRKVTATHAFAVGNWIYRKSDGTFALAKSDSENTAEVMGVVVKINGTTDFWYVTEGYVTGLSGMTAGTVQWLSPTTAGAQTETKPSVLGQIESPLGVALSATEMNVNIMRGTAVGGTNLYTTIGLTGSTSNGLYTTTIQNVSNLVNGTGGKLTGFAYIDATTDSVFTFDIHFTKYIDGSNYGVSTIIGAGVVPPMDGGGNEFAVTVTTGGSIQMSLPGIAGFVSAHVTFAMNAPNVGAKLPLQIDSSFITWTPLGTHTHADDTSGGYIEMTPDFGEEPGAVSSSTSGQAGTATTVSRSDHNHDLGAHTHTNEASGGVIVAASTIQQGAVTTGAQSLAGAKTLAGSFQTTTSSGSSNAVNALLSNSFAETATGTRTITVTNLADGQAINIAVSGALNNVISWTTTGLTQKVGMTYSNTMTSALSIYTLLRIGSNVYISVLHGF
jgi:hypothetical protein